MFCCFCFFIPQAIDVHCHKVHSLILTWPSATRSSSETKGQSVGSGKGVAKVFKKGKESLWDVTLKRAVTWLM